MIPALRTIYEDELMRVAVAQEALDDPKPARVLLSFSGIGHGMGGIEIQRPEFVRAGQGYGRVLFVSDLTRSWGNSLDFGRLQQLLAPLVQDAELDVIGNSMGGFLALLAPSYFEVKRALGFSPQFSVHPEIAPWEPRWTDYRRGIRDWKIPSLQDRFNDRTTYYVFCSRAGVEGRHLAMFPRKPNLHLVGFEGFGHEVAAELKKVGILHELIARCMNDSFDEAWMRDCLRSHPPEPREPAQLSKS